MTTPKYFSYLPNIQYAQTVNKAEQINFITAKDFFRLMLPRDDIYKEETLYTTYIVSDGERPDQISYDLYGDEQYYWIILQINNIIDYYNQWPLSNKELEEYSQKKYGGLPGSQEIHHYETVETYDESGNFVLPGGLEVPSDYIYYYPDKPGSSVTLSSLPAQVTNFTYERRINEEKQQIFILKSRYISDYVREVKKRGFDIKTTQRSQIITTDILR